MAVNSNKNDLNALGTLWKILHPVMRYSGVLFLILKFTHHGSQDRKEPSGFIWLIGIYAALYGIADSIYQSEISRSYVEGARGYFVEGFDPKTLFRSNAMEDPDWCQLERILHIQESKPLKPHFLDPRTVMYSVFGERVAGLRIENSSDLRLMNIIGRWFPYLLSLESSITGEFAPTAKSQGTPLESLEEVSSALRTCERAYSLERRLPWEWRFHNACNELVTKSMCHHRTTISNPEMLKFAAHYARNFARRENNLGYFIFSLDRDEYIGYPRDGMVGLSEFEHRDLESGATAIAIHRINFRGQDITGPGILTAGPKNTLVEVPIPYQSEGGDLIFLQWVDMGELYGERIFGFGFKKI